MSTAESLEDFYQRVSTSGSRVLSANNAGIGHFNVFTRESCNAVTPYSRRDFYKVSLILGTGKVHYADRWIALDKPALLFSNPVVPYAWEAESKKQSGWFCLFTEAFLLEGDRSRSLKESPLFKVGGHPVFFVDRKQQAELSDIFQKMMADIASDYAHKYDMLRNRLFLLIHEAMKMNPSENFERHKNASSRITTLFLELLERQFPIDTPESCLKLRTATDYAYSLSVHVNHLNRSVKEVTEEPPPSISPAAWCRKPERCSGIPTGNVSEIAYGLGFEYPPYFTNFFRKNAGMSPIQERNAAV